jgi:hypothetical protein
VPKPICYFVEHEPRASTLIPSTRRIGRRDGRHRDDRRPSMPHGQHGMNTRGAGGSLHARDSSSARSLARRRGARNQALKSCRVREDKRQAHLQAAPTSPLLPAAHRRRSAHFRHRVWLFFTGTVCGHATWVRSCHSPPFDSRFDSGVRCARVRDSVARGERRIRSRCVQEQGRSRGK